MRSFDRQLSIALLVALVATAGATAQEPSLAGLTGSWRSPSQGVAGGQTGERVETTGKLVLDGQWLELEVRTISDDGPRSGDRLMLRQQADGSVIAYVFSADQESATRLEGGWSPQGALELAGAGSDTGFVCCLRCAARKT